MSKEGRISTTALTITLLLCAFLAEGAGKDPKSEKLPDAAEKIRPLLIGAKVPALLLRNADGSSFDLNATMARRPTIVVFYRGGW